eukprot:5917128-Pleurochrysis_carterae.AAC.1
MALAQPKDWTDNHQFDRLIAARRARTLEKLSQLALLPQQRHVHLVRSGQCFDVLSPSGFSAETEFVEQAQREQCTLVAAKERRRL